MYWFFSTSLNDCSRWRTSSFEILRIPSWKGVSPCPLLLPGLSSSLRLWCHVRRVWLPTAGGKCTECPSQLGTECSQQSKGGESSTLRPPKIPIQRWTPASRPPGQRTLFCKTKKGKNISLTITLIKCIDQRNETKLIWFVLLSVMVMDIILIFKGTPSSNILKTFFRH